MEVCPTCDRTLPDPATPCEYCLARPADLVPTAPGDPAPTSSGGLGRREVLMIAVAVLGSGAITLAVLSARAVVPAAAAAASVPGAGASPTARLDSVPPAGPGWVENRALWTGSDRKSLAFELPARNETAVWMKKVRPLLVVRCVARRMDVFVYTDSAAAMEAQDEDHTVQVAFDGEPERTERWPDSVAHDALFAPDGPGMAERLSHARTMRFGYTPHNAPPVVAHFDVPGLAERLRHPACQP